MRLNDDGYSLLEILLVTALAAVVSAIAIPTSSNAISGLRLTGDARGVSAAVAMAKMRAAANFSRARLYVDVSTSRHHLETYQKTGTPGWVTEGGETSLSQGVSFGYGALTSPPANTQAAIGQAPACLNNSGTAITNTACVVFNSRGIPIDATGAPTAAAAVYVTDGKTVFGVTVSANGMSQLWKSLAATAAWVRQ